jgi:hypothetical protein
VDPALAGIFLDPNVAVVGSEVVGTVEVVRFVPVEHDAQLLDAGGIERIEPREVEAARSRDRTTSVVVEILSPGVDEVERVGLALHRRHVLEPHEVEAARALRLGLETGGELVHVDRAPLVLREERHEPPGQRARLGSEAREVGVDAPRGCIRTEDVEAALPQEKLRVVIGDVHVELGLARVTVLGQDRDDFSRRLA